MTHTLPDLIEHRHRSPVATAPEFGQLGWVLSGARSGVRSSVINPAICDLRRPPIFLRRPGTSMRAAAFGAAVLALVSVLPWPERGGMTYLMHREATFSATSEARSLAMAASMTKG